LEYLNSHHVGPELCDEFFIGEHPGGREDLLMGVRTPMIT
jgi:hypothetical protein